MANIEKHRNNANSTPFSLNWKDALMIGLFLVGAGGIIYSIRETDKSVENGVSANLIEKVENQQLAQVENPVSTQNESSQTTTHTQVQTQPPVNTATENRTIEMSQNQQISETKKVESPLSDINATKKTPAPVAKEEEMIAKSIENTPVTQKSERGLILATDVKARTGAPTTQPTPIPVKPKAYTPSKTAGTGNFFLIAASRSNLEEATKAVESLKQQGFAKPVILEPSKEAGTTNFRIAIYRDVDRVKVDEYVTANADKTKGFWVWQKK